MKDGDNNASFKYSTFHYGSNVCVYECYLDAATKGGLLGETLGMTIGTTLGISVDEEEGI